MTAKIRREFEQLNDTFSIRVETDNYALYKKLRNYISAEIGQWEESDNAPCEMAEGIEP